VLRTEPEIAAAFIATGQASLQFHHMLDHGNASRIASIAAECAGTQDPLAFWQLRTLLFERQNDLFNASSETVTSWAGEVGLDVTAFAACQADPAVAEKVERMNQERIDAGIRQRPSFDINGQIIAGALPLSQFERLIVEAATP
jgi:protein-disulfide isomerase